MRQVALNTHISGTFNIELENLRNSVLTMPQRQGPDLVVDREPRGRPQGPVRRQQQRVPGRLASLTQSPGESLIAARKGSGRFV